MTRAAILVAFCVACGGSAGDPPEVDGPRSCEIVLDDTHRVETVVHETVTFTLMQWRQRIPAVRALDDASATFTVASLGDVAVSYDGASVVVAVDGHEAGACLPEVQP